jgi:hypothetical protein
LLNLKAVLTPPSKWIASVGIRMMGLLMSTSLQQKLESLSVSMTRPVMPRSRSNHVLKRDADAGDAMGDAMGNDV